MSGVPETPQNLPPRPDEPQGPGGRETNPDARMWAMFAHLAGLAGIAIPGLGSVLGPLIVWLLKKEQYPFVEEQGREALNFQITMLIYGFVAGLLMFVCIGFVLVLAVGVVDLVFLIIAAIKANNGEHYRYPYPLIFRFVK